MIALIIARLKTVPGLRLVEGLAEWSVLDAPPLLVPAAYVLPSTTEAGGNALAAGGFRQPVTEAAQVIVLTRNLRDARGDQASLDLIAARDAARAALLGWVPATGWTPIELAAGALVGMEGDAVVWRDTVTSRTQLTRV